MIRTLTITDALTLNHINKEQLGYDVPLSVTENQLIKLLNDTDHHFFLGFEDQETKEILGYVHAEVYETIYSKTFFNILALAVSKENVGQGIGKKLMSVLETETRTRGYDGIRLNSGIKRIHAHKFYEAIGFISDKDQKRFRKFIN
ncbi:GNAT family N-acetyltransferase [Enterococcus sp. LJL99]